MLGRRRRSAKRSGCVSDETGEEGNLGGQRAKKEKRVVNGGSGYIHAGEGERIVDRVGEVQGVACLITKS